MKQNELSKLKSRLQKVEAELEKWRSQVQDYALSAPRTQKRWKAERKWDYLAHEKMELLTKIEELSGTNV